MSFVGKLARGLATGLGGYYGKVAEQQDEDRKSQILMDRERALAQINHDYRTQEQHSAGVEARATNHAEAVDRFKSEKALLPAKADQTIRVSEAEERAKLSTWYKQQPIEYRNKVKLANAEHDFRLAEQHDQQVWDANHKPVAQTEGPGGATTLLYSGDRSSTTYRGTRERAPRAAASSDDPLSLGDDTATTSGGGIAPRAAARPAPQVQAPAQDAEAMGNWSRLVAESASHPNYKNMSAEERYNALVPLAQTLQSKGVKIMIPPPLNGGR